MRASATYLRALGTPAAGRAAVRDGRPAAMRLIFSEHLRGDEARVAIADLSERVRDGGLCLLCPEADPGHCHRTLVAEAVGLPFRHLHLPSPLKPQDSPSDR